MKQACIQMIGAALGRAPTSALTGGIDDRINRQMRLLASKDPAAWRALPQADRLQQAAQAAAQEVIAEVIKKQQRVLKDIAALDRIETFLADKLITKPGAKLRAVSQLLAFDTKRQAGTLGFSSAASNTKALQMETFGQLIDTWQATSPKFFGLFDNKEGTTDLIRELFGEHTGNADAAAGAKVWKEAMENLRQRYNAAGGDTGALADWHFPQSHSQPRIASAGFDRWFSDTLPLLDRKRYANPDGTLMDDSQMKGLFAQIYDSIITDGNNKRDTTRPAGSRIPAERGSEHRAVFYKDADSYLAYQGNYGEKSLWNTLTGHVRATARDTAMIETLGPNAERTFGAINQRILLEELRENPTAASKLQKAAKFNDKLFDMVSGRQEVVDPELARKFQAVRNFTTAAKLPKVFLTAMSDYAGMASTAFANKVPFSDMFMRSLRTLNPASHADRHALESNGIGMESMIGSLNRFGQDEYNSGWTSKLATTTMHASGAERMWDSRRQGTAAVLMSYIARTVKRVDHFADINKADHGVLADKGISEKDWQVWKLAQPELWNGTHEMVTPKSIHAIPDEALMHLGDPQTLRREAATHLLAHVLEEAGMSAMDTGPRERTRMLLGTTAGTKGGELLKSALLFKSFAASMMMKHWARASSMPGAGSKFGYVAPLIVYGSIIAALTNQVRNVLTGKDPENMADPRFWGAAILRGGGLGFFGDFFYDEFTSHDTSLIAALGGPLATTAEDVWKLTGAAAIHHLRGERTDEGGNLVRFAKENTPVLGLWYLQAAMDHILWNQMQEAASPGYLDRMQAKMEATKGTSWYWRPDEPRPERAPDTSLAHVWDPEAAGRQMQRFAQNVGIE